MRPLARRFLTMALISLAAAIAPACGGGATADIDGGGRGGQAGSSGVGTGGAAGTSGAGTGGAAGTSGAGTGGQGERAAAPAWPVTGRPAPRERVARQGPTLREARRGKARGAAQVAGATMAWAGRAAVVARAALPAARRARQGAVDKVVKAGRAAPAERPARPALPEQSSVPLTTKARAFSCSVESSTTPTGSSFGIRGGQQAPLGQRLPGSGELKSQYRAVGHRLHPLGGQQRRAPPGRRRATAGTIYNHMVVMPGAWSSPAGTVTCSNDASDA